MNKGQVVFVVFLSSLNRTLFLDNGQLSTEILPQLGMFFREERVQVFLIFQEAEYVFHAPQCFLGHVALI